MGSFKNIFSDLLSVYTWSISSLEIALRIPLESFRKSSKDAFWLFSRYSTDYFKDSCISAGEVFFRNSSRNYGIYFCGNAAGCSSMQFLINSYRIFCTDSSKNCLNPSTSFFLLGEIPGNSPKHILRGFGIPSGISQGVFSKKKIFWFLQECSCFPKTF